MTFTHAHRDHRVRGACRLAGALAALALAFVQSLDGILSWHEARYVLVLIPPVAGWLAGELAVSARRMRRACEVPIPRARLVRGRTAATRHE